MQNQMKSVCESTQEERSPRSVSSIVHPDRPCQQCSLCKRRNLSKHSHPKLWKNLSLLQQLQTIDLSLNMQPDSCIWLSCRNDVSTIHDSSFSPRWKKITDIVRQCYVPNCLNNDTKMYCKYIGCINLPMQGLAPTQEQSSDTGSETSSSSGNSWNMKLMNSWMTSLEMHT